MKMILITLRWKTTIAVKIFTAKMVIYLKCLMKSFRVKTITSYGLIDFLTAEPIVYMDDMEAIVKLM